MEVLCYSASNVHCSDKVKVHSIRFLSGTATRTCISLETFSAELVKFAQRVGTVLSCRIHVTSCCGYVLPSGAHG